MLKFPMVANTSFQAEKPGIADNTVFRYKTLASEELDIIDEMTGSNSKKVLNMTDRTR